MKVVCFANNEVGLGAVRHLRDSDAEIVALIVHKPEQQKYGSEIIEAANVESENLICARQLDAPSTIKQIAALKPDCGVSAFFGHIIRRPVIDLFPRGIINLHTSLLPLNRGSWPNVWTIVEDSAAGVSMHLVDEGVDTGPILAQTKVEVSPADTGLSLNQKLQDELIQLFRDNWSRFANGELTPMRQDDSQATVHRVKDAASIDRIDLDASYKARDLINILRARTSPPHQGAWFEVDGQRYFLQLKIEKE